MDFQGYDIACFLHSSSFLYSPGFQQIWTNGRGTIWALSTKKSGTLFRPILPPWFRNRCAAIELPLLLACLGVLEVDELKWIGMGIWISRLCRRPGKMFVRKYWYEQTSKFEKIDINKKNCCFNVFKVFLLDIIYLIEFLFVHVSSFFHLCYKKSHPNTSRTLPERPHAFLLLAVQELEKHLVATN